MRGYGSSLSIRVSTACVKMIGSRRYWRDMDYPPKSRLTAECASTERPSVTPFPAHSRQSGSTHKEGSHAANHLTCGSTGHIAAVQLDHSFCSTQDQRCA